VVAFALPLARALVVLLYGFQQIVSMLFAHVLHAKVVKDQVEANRAVFAFPEPWCGLTLVIAVLVEVLLQELLGNDAAYGKPYIPCLTSQ
jgi:hypothetical protein